MESSLIVELMAANGLDIGISGYEKSACDRLRHPPFHRFIVKAIRRAVVRREVISDQIPKCG